MLSKRVSVRSSSGGSPPGSTASLLDEWERYCTTVRGLSAKTVRRRRMYLERFIAHVSPSSSASLLQWVGVAHLQDFMVSYARAYGPGSQEWMVKALRGLLRFCHYQGYLPRDLSCAVPSRCHRRLAHVPRGLESESIERLLGAIDRSCPVGRRDAAIITLVATYGVRGVQARTLRLDDIDWEAEEVHFPAVKGGKALCLPLVADVGNAILDYLRNGRPNQAPYREVFLQVRSPFLPFDEGGGFSKIVSRRLQHAGVDVRVGVSRGTHSLRHAFATRLAGRVPFKHIADLLGHRELDTSFLYTKVDFRGLQETVLPWPEEVVA